MSVKSRFRTTANSVLSNPDVQHQCHRPPPRWLDIRLIPPYKAIEKINKEQSEHVSLESLAAVVEDFTPKAFSTFIRQPENPLNLYCAGRLWATSGLMQDRTSKEIAVWLSLSESMAKEAEDAFSNLQGLWLEDALEGMRDEVQYSRKLLKNNLLEVQCLGRLFFTSFLQYIRERQCRMLDMSCSGLHGIEKQVENWQPYGARGQLEKQLLLKELRIGRRSQKLPSWTGHVSNMSDVGVRFQNTGWTVGVVKSVKKKKSVAEQVAVKYRATGHLLALRVSAYFRVCAL
jgi:hypothetical protein